MKLHFEAHAARNIFTAHGAGYVAVGGERYEHPVVVTAEQVFTDWRPQEFDALIEVHFAYFLPLQPEVLLLGTGATLRFPHPGLYRALIAARIGVEFMNTPAACRTYNILLGEGRKVVAAILL
ncbi:MAG: Mth938-like domain-containing protein [Nitrosomonadales bacterium]|nr:Mth938-like domain-containing protein [Nitrosomonadales bacterium]